ncbi:hypothetical protein ACLKA6_005689 [Drosophila palustris]
MIELQLCGAVCTADLRPTLANTGSVLCKYASESARKAALTKEDNPPSAHEPRPEARLEDEERLTAIAMDAPKHRKKHSGKSRENTTGTGENTETRPARSMAPDAHGTTFKAMASRVP